MNNSEISDAIKELGSRIEPHNPAVTAILYCVAGAVLAGATDSLHAITHVFAGELLQELQEARNRLKKTSWLHEALND